MSIEKTKALSLGTIRLGETSRIVTFLTQEFGLIKCVAKGSCSKRSKFGSSLEPFTQSSIIFYHKPRGGLFTLSHTDILNFFPKTRSELSKTAYAQVPIDLLKHVLLPAGKEKETYLLTEKILAYIENTSTESEYAFSLVSFVFNMCKNLGFLPNLECCYNCGQQNQEMFFDFSNGCLYCRQCRKLYSGRTVRKETLLLLNMLSKNNNILSQPDRHVSLNALRLLLDYLSFHTEKKLYLHSLNFLESL